MSQYRNIMVIADPQQPGSPALRRAGALAKASGATLHLRLFCHHPGITAVGLFNREVAELARKELLQEQHHWLEREADSLRTRVPQVRVDVLWGEPVHDAIVAEVQNLKPDLVLKDVESVPALKRLLFTPLDWHLLRLCPAPLLMVNRVARVLPKRVIAAVDMASDTSDNAEMNNDIVRAALELALQCDAQVNLAHSFEGLPPVPRTAIGDLGMTGAGIYEELRGLRKEGFRAFADRLGVPMERRHFLDGPTDIALAGLANDTAADVVVLGSVTRTGLERILMGSTAERLLGGLSCDVLVIKPERFAVDLARHHPLAEAA